MPRYCASASAKLLLVMVTTTPLAEAVSTFLSGKPTPFARVVKVTSSDTAAVGSFSQVETFSSARWLSSSCTTTATASPFWM